MLLADMHSHSHFSIDSKNTIQASCEAAIRKGFKAVAITDHLDHNPKEWGVGFYNPEGYFNELEMARTRYGNQIQMLSGIEFSDAHLYPKELDEMGKYPYDVILGSMHWIDAGYLGEKKILEIIPQEEVEARYFKGLMQIIQQGGIDVLAHLDLTKRTFGNRVISPKILTELLRALVKSNIALEINTSSLRKGLTESMPEVSLIEEFIRLGGRRLTLGSDAHFSQDIGADFEGIIELLSEEARRCVGFFVQRQFVSLWELEHQELCDEIAAYGNKWPEERKATELFLAFLNKEESSGLTLTQQAGHITGSAWIVNRSHTKVLLTHHRKLGIWVQLGGHVEAYEIVRQGAYREAIEESGLTSIQLLSSEIFDIDAHNIPANVKQGEHTHFDVRFIFEADEEETLLISAESKDLKWVDLSNIGSYSTERSIYRMVEKTR